jgi:hypothetical protein
VVKKGPDVAQAARVGEPTLVDPTPVAASGVVTAAARAAIGGASGEHGVSIEKVNGSGTLGPSDPAPRSDAPAPPPADPFARLNTAPDPNELKPATDANELKPGPPDPNELKPSSDAQGAAVPPTQVNEIQAGPAPASGNTVASSDSSSTPATDQDISSSKKKKKTGLKKVISF